MSEEKKGWYVLRAISGKEAKVKEILDAEIKNTDLGQYVFQVLIPTEKTYVVRNGKRVAKNAISIPVMFLSRPYLRVKLFTFYVTRPMSSIFGGKVKQA